jgi:soluble lytic murein transglycosylase
MGIGRLLAAALAALCIGGAAWADILVMSGPDGRMLITNRGERSGYKVISRHREFFGSSGMGLHSAVAGDPSKYEDAVRLASHQYKLDPSLVKAVIRAESNFLPGAISPKGAMGLMQLMPDTARMHGVRNAFDPTDNIVGGVRHLRHLMNRYDGRLDYVLSAYNAGTRPVDAADGIPSIPETQEYVRRVRMFHAIYKNSQPERKPAPAVLATAATTRQPMVARADVDRGPREQVDGVPLVLRAKPAH